MDYLISLKPTMGLFTAIIMTIGWYHKNKSCHHRHHHHHIIIFGTLLHGYTLLQWLTEKDALLDLFHKPLIIRIRYKQHGISFDGVNYKKCFKVLLKTNVGVWYDKCNM